MTTRRIAVIAAGTGTPSSTRLLADRLAAAVGTELRSRGVPAQVEIVELREHARALADAVVTGFPSGRLRDAIRTVTTADAVVTVTPVFAASYSGLFKTFVDVLEPDALAGTPVLLAATAGTARHSLVIEHAMRPLFSYLRALTVPTGVFAAPEDWAQGDAAPLADRIRRAAAELADLMTHRAPAAAADPFEDPIAFEDLLDQGTRGINRRDRR
jgi:FMN reductase